MKKINASIKIAIGFALILGLGYGGFRLYTEWRIGQIHYPNVVPGRVNLVAVQPGVGYRIIVANQVAQLAEVEGAEFGTGKMSEDAGEVQNPRRIHLREMLGALRGNVNDLSKLVTSINELDKVFETEGKPVDPVVWTSENLEKALTGNKQLITKLEKDINVRLDGSPIPQVSRKALFDGIMINSPVMVKVQVGDQVKTLEARIEEIYRPRLMRDLFEVLKTKPDLEDETIRGYYEIEARKLEQDGSLREDVARSLKARIDPGRLQEYSVKPEHLLVNSKVILTEAQMTGAHFRTYVANGQRLNDFDIELTEEGQERLWKYSYGKQGFQLLLIVDGVAVAAPRIRHTLNSRVVSIVQVPEETLVQRTADIINQLKK